MSRSLPAVITQIRNVLRGIADTACYRAGDVVVKRTFPGALVPPKNPEGHAQRLAEDVKGILNRATILDPLGDRIVFSVVYGVEKYNRAKDETRWEARYKLTIISEDR